MPLYHKETVTASAGEQTEWYPLNQYGVPFNVSFGVFVSGTAFEPTCRVEHTFDGPVSAGSDYFVHADVSGVALSSGGAIDGNYAFPISAIRLRVTAVSGTGTIRWYVRQAGN